MQSKGLSRVFSNTTVQKHQFFGTQLSLWSNSHNPYTTTGKTIALTRRTFVGKVMSVLLNSLSRLLIAFLPRRKCVLISCLLSLSAVILEPKKIKFVTVGVQVFEHKMRTWLGTRLATQTRTQQLLSSPALMALERPTRRA